MECIQTLREARMPPYTCSGAMPSSDNKLFCRIPDKSRPKMSANPFRTAPQRLVTMPTITPPAALVKTGIHVFHVQPFAIPDFRSSLPSGDPKIKVTIIVTNEIALNSMLKMHTSRPATCKFFCETAPAMEETSYDIFSVNVHDGRARRT